MKNESGTDYGLTETDAWAKYWNGDLSAYSSFNNKGADVNLTYDLNNYKPDFLSGVNIDANYDRRYMLTQGGNKIASASPSVSLRTGIPYSSEDGKLNANIGATFTHGYKPYFYGDVNYRLTDMNSPHNFILSANADSQGRQQYGINYSYTKQF